jgi:pyruvate/2-oxoglutarate dehydrogenase complex dihydrolipoamide dehydrogenase (E3) component
LIDSGYVTSDTLQNNLKKLDAMPQRLVVLGGGPHWVQLAQSFARLGSQITLVEMGTGFVGAGRR